MKRPYARRCGASAPDSDARKGWHYCYVEAGHEGMHADDARVWQDDDTVEVRTVEEIATVPDHEHDFPQLGQDGDATCSMDPECMLTWNEHMKQQRDWAEEQADTCSHCGHAEHCHTTSLPEEGGRDYCTECQGAYEFHAMDEEPPVTRERLLEIVRGLLPGASQERLEGAVDRMRVMLALADPEPVVEPQGSPQGRLEGVRPHGVVVDEAEIPQAPQNEMDDDVCYCGCTYKQHRSFPSWGESCDGCTAKGPRATYQWRHPFSRDVGRIKR